MPWRRRIIHLIPWQRLDGIVARGGLWCVADGTPVAYPPPCGPASPSRNHPYRFTGTPTTDGPTRPGGKNAEPAEAAVERRVRPGHGRVRPDRGARGDRSDRRLPVSAQRD